MTTPQQRGYECLKCGTKLEVGVNWYKSGKRFYNYKCKECRNEHNRYVSYLHGAKPMNENRNCAVFLGIYVSENVLSQVFENVEKQPYGNKGYDFVCNHGKKIDVKSACLTAPKHTNYTNRWVFRLNKNKIADFFLCLAFDNREDLNPLHIWLLPSHLFNHLTVIAISDRSIDKWSEYSIPIDDIVSICNNLKVVGNK